MQHFGGGYAFRVMPWFAIPPQLAKGVTPESPSELHATLRAVFGDGPTGTDPEQTKLTRGEALCQMVERLGFTNVQAWRAVYPSSGVSDADAKRSAIRARKKHRAEHPMGILDALYKHGVTIDYLVEVIARGLEVKKLHWNNDKGDYEESTFHDTKEQRAAALAILRDIVKLDEKARQELAVGKAEMRKMHLNTGKKFKTIAEWNKYMDGQDEKLKEERALAAKEMKLISAGRQIYQEEGPEAAERYRQMALGAGLTGDEHIPGIDEPDDDEIKPSPPAGRQ